MNQYRKIGDWMSSDLVDALGKEFSVGDRIAKACSSGRAVNIEITTVTRIENGKLYLGGSKVAVHFPGRLVNLTKYSED